jgi:hypothetical protein
MYVDQTSNTSIASKAEDRPFCQRSAIVCRKSCTRASDYRYFIVHYSGLSRAAAGWVNAWLYPADQKLRFNFIFACWPIIREKIYDISAAKLSQAAGGNHIDGHCCGQQNAGPYLPAATHEHVVGSSPATLSAAAVVALSTAKSYTSYWKTCPASEIRSLKDGIKHELQMRRLQSGARNFHYPWMRMISLGSRHDVGRLRQHRSRKHNLVEQSATGETITHRVSNICYARPFIAVWFVEEPHDGIVHGIATHVNVEL